MCEIHQAVLGYAGDPQPVVQNVQVHGVDFGGLYIRTKSTGFGILTSNIWSSKLGNESLGNRRQLTDVLKTVTKPPPVFFPEVLGELKNWRMSG